MTSYGSINTLGSLRFHNDIHDDRHHEAASLLSASWNDAAKMESGRATRSPSTLLSSSKSSSSVVNDGAGGEDERPGGVWSKQRRLSEQYKLSSQCNAPGDDAVVANTNLKRLIFAVVLCSLFMIGELVGGYIANSLAIMTDAAHLLSDVAGFVVSIIAIWLSRRPATSKLSYGFYRAEVVGAIISVLLIWVLTVILVIEAIDRVINPEEFVDGKIITIVAIIGIFINLVLGYVLFQGGHGHSHGGGIHEAHSHSHGGTDENINVRSAFIHVIGDLVQTVGVLIAGIIIWVNPDYKIADPICTFIFSILVLYTTISILKDALHVIMEGSPRNMDTELLYNHLSQLPGVVAVHDLHVWSLTMGKPSLSVCPH